MNNFLAYLEHVFTDYLKRPEIKNIIGVPATIIGLVLGALGYCKVIPVDWIGWGAWMGVAVGLIVTTAVQDSKGDKAVLAAGGQPTA
jgi:hypothetical protein